MYKVTFLLLLILTITVAVPAAGAQEARPGPFEEALTAADVLYLERGDLDKARKAYRMYKKALQHRPGDYEGLYKAARAAFYLLENITVKRRKKEIVAEAREYAEKAVKVNPKGVEGHFWLGVIYTKVGEIKGVLKALFLIKPAKKKMFKVIRMDEAYEGAGAYVVLGRIYSQVPGLFGGSDKKARKYFEKARSIFPKNTLNLLFMAETYWDLDEEDLAVKTLEELINLEADPRYIPESKKHKKEARRLLKKYRKK